VMVTRDTITRLAHIQTIVTVIRDSRGAPEFKIDPEIDGFKTHAVAILQSWIRDMLRPITLSSENAQDSWTLARPPSICPTENQVATVGKPRQVNLSKWALAMEDGQRWHLYHCELLKREYVWKLSGKVDISNGRCCKLARRFVELKGAVTKNEATELLQDYGATSQEVWSGTVGPAIRDLGKVVRIAIGRVAKCDTTIIANPFPYNKPRQRYVAAIDVGTAVQDEAKPSRLRYCSSSFDQKSS
jgi:hypothetical protein